jgi:twinkle protein
MTQHHQPCPDCKSSDAMSIYDDHSYCFSCNKYTSFNKEFIDDKSSYEFIEHRGLSKETYRFYDVKCKIDPLGQPIHLGFPYGGGSFKVRTIEGKKIWSMGLSNPDTVPLFGMDRFSAGSAKSITITEGEYDALSVFQMLGSKYPAVSIRSASSGRRDCENAREYLNSFERIYLCLDDDQPGREATANIAKLFDPHKVFVVKLSRYKDANEYLVNDAAKEFTGAWWSAKQYMPEGVVADYGAVERILRSESAVSTASYPIRSLQESTYGIRPGEVVLLTAQEGVGKTEVLRSIEHHLLKTTEDNLAIIHLEEGEKRSVQGLVGLELNVPVHLPDAGVSVEDQVLAFQKLTKKDSRLHIYSHFGSNDPDNILDIIRYLATVCRCKYITLDHITMIVTGAQSDDERKTLDYLSTELARLTRELSFTLFLVSHVNDDGKTRGSRNISKIADLWVELNRDTDAGSLYTDIKIKKNRFSGKTGQVGTLVFDPVSYKLNEMEHSDTVFQPLEGLQDQGSSSRH